jgi:Fe-Mn family superoxide dismutase
VSNVNAALSKFPEFEGLGIEEVNKRAGTSQLPNEIATTVRNNGGGHWNHSFFWRIMCNPSSSGGPAGELKHAIESSFGSVGPQETSCMQPARSKVVGWNGVLLD